MQTCEVCGGRVISTPEGYRCRNAQCAGTRSDGAQGVPCATCGGAMHYTGLNAWGEPNYACTGCGATAKL